MNILVIGNGFDLAHGLPTKYTDFLDFCIKIRDVINNAYNRNTIWFNEEVLFEWKKEDEIKELLENIYKTTLRIIVNRKLIVKLRKKYYWVSELYKLVEGNIWIEYFESKKGNQKEYWIDFEHEISYLIQQIDADMLSSDEKQYELEDIVYRLSNSFLAKRYNDSLQSREQNNSKITFKQLRDDLKNDLDKLTRALEIYLIKAVGSIKVNVSSPEIIAFVPDYVLSFNYTDTYQKLYGKRNNMTIDYIHGKADFTNTIDTNNMVLGIDEYLQEDRKNSDLEFLKFKKYYQRINKEIKCNYKEYLEKIKLLKKNEIHNIYLYGHSLDITDKDIIRDLFLINNVHIIVYYLNQSDKDNKIENLIKIIGHDELERRTYGSMKTIEFKQQQDMVAI